jgi:methyltransferase-like protein
MPSDALRPRYMSDFSKFLYTSYADQRALHSNTQDAILAYTSRLENIALWDSELQMAVVYGLAANICMPLSGKPSRAKMLADRANEIITSARVNAANSNNETYESIPDWIAARGFNGMNTQRYFHPYGSLLSVATT